MTSSRKTILAIAGFAAFLILASVAYASLTGGAGPAGATTAGTTRLQTAAPRIAPDFTVYDADGQAVRLIDFAGRPVVLNFWASWCGPCKSEMPMFNQVHESVKDDIAFMMVDLVDGQRETQAIGQAYVDEQGFTFPVYFDTRQQAATRYGISSIPTTYFINAEGQIVYAYRGAMEESVLRAGIELISG